MKINLNSLFRRVIFFLYILILNPPDILAYLSTDSLEFYSKMRQVAFFMGAMLSLFYLLQRKIEKNLVYIFFFTGWVSLCDIVAGINSMPTSLYDMMRILGLCILISCCYKNNTIVDLYFSIATYMSILVFANLISQIKMPDGIIHGHVFGWQPYYVLANPNSFAYSYLFAFIFCLAYTFKVYGRITKRLVLFVIVFVISTLLGNYSTTGFIISLLMLFSITLKNHVIVDIIRKRLKSIIFLTLSLVLFMILGGWKLPLIQNTVTYVTGEYSSFLERGAIWTNGIHEVLNSPIWGHGSSILRYSIGSSGELRSAHNTFLQIALNGGIPALVIYLLMIFEALKKIHYNFKKDIYYYLLFCLLFIILEFAFEQRPYYIGFFSLITIIDCEYRQHIKCIGVENNADNF